MSSSNKNMPKMRTCLRNLVFKQRCRSNQRHKIPETHGVSVQMGLHMPKNVMKCKVDEGKGIGLNLDQGLFCNPIFRESSYQRVSFFSWHNFGLATSISTTYQLKKNLIHSILIAVTNIISFLINCYRGCGIRHLQF